MAEGMMSRPPTGGGLKELSARQQRRKQYLERRGREFKPSGQVSGQPTEMPEMTARQQRRQQYLARRDARRQRAVEDYRAQQQAQQAGNALGQFADFNKPNTMENPYKDYTRLTDRELYEMGYDPRDYNIVSRGPTGQISSTLVGYDMSPLDPQERERLWQERLNNPRPTYSPNASSGPLQTLTPEQLAQARTMFSGGSGGQGYGNMIGQLPAGVSQGQAVGAAVQEPERLPSPAMLNNMPGQPFGQYTAAGQYRPLPFYATPQQIRERQALIQGGHYFNQLTPAQRMR